MLDLVTSAVSNRHPAVQRCLDAGYAAHAEARSQQKTDYQCEECFKHAYLKTMPDLSTPDNISGFISCVTYALVTGVIYRDDSRGYLYAAQVALTAVRRAAIKSKPEAA